MTYSNLRPGVARVRVLFFVALAIFFLTAASLVTLFVRDNSYTTPMVGGTYREGIVGTLTSINPLLSALNPVEEDVTALVFSGLTKYDIKQKKIVPDLATFESNAAYTEFTFFLNPQALWHDGTPLTAEDVVFTYNLIASDDFPNAYVHSIFANITVTKVDESTVKFTLPNSYQFFPTATTIGILPKHIWQDVTPDMIRDKASVLPIVGSGPYKVASEDATAKTQTSQTVQLERNPQYYGEVPYMEFLSLQFFSTIEELMEKRNALLGIRSVPYERISEVESQQRFSVIPIATSKYTALFYNTERAALKTAKLRLGLSLGLDKDLIIGSSRYLAPITSPFLNNDTAAWQNIMDLDKAKGSLYDSGYRFPTDEQIVQKQRDLVWSTMSGSLMPATTTEVPTDNQENTNMSVMEDTEGQSSSETVENTGTENANENSSSPEIVQSTNENTNAPAGPSEEELKKQIDLSSVDFSSLTIQGQRAQDILDEYKKYRINDRGERLTLTVVTLDSPALLSEKGAIVVNMWKALGVDARLEIKNSREMVDVLRTRSYDVLLIGQELGYDMDLFPFWHSSNARTVGRNLSNYKNPALDTLIDSIRSQKKLETEDAMDDALAKNVEEIEKIFLNDMPAIFLWRQTDYFAIDKKIKNVYIQNLVQPKDRFSAISSWYEREGKNPKGQLSVSNFTEWLRNYL